MKGKKLTYTISRILLGLGFIFFGAMKFFPAGATGLPEPAMAFMTAMYNTGYFIPLLGVAELLVGILLVFNRWVPFSMVILSALMVNIILFNVFLAPSLVGLVMMLVILALQVYIMHYTWKSYKPLFANLK